MKHLEEKTLSTKQIFKGRYLRIEQDQVQAPDGRTYTREYILHPGAAMMIPLLSNGNIVMIHQYRHAVKQVFLEFPAGKRDHNEETLLTAQRELLEETGYQAKDWKFLTTIHPVIGYSNEHIDLFLARDLTVTQQKLDHGEFIEVVEVKPEDLMRLVRDGKVSDVKTQIGAFWLDKILRGEWN
ncbi:MAG: ADP-ribose pyrophosphatase [Bdellovibrio sp. ArHS]|uniref:NUDIX domain-containing protein n=1 Tax=Bdellovibrio sp. ArHS TaxID=1569284 RepID=UPI000582D7B3|nr:NUDIX hydrolase [Bdellovibrio sp. ArHS]KHD89223.1 MAG: ADP-ribose pyrophosphatase [Bdellovibrio sp. ArHS]